MMLAGAHNEDQVSNYGNKSGIMVLVDDHIRQWESVLQSH